MPGESRPQSQASITKAAARTSAVLVPQGALEGQPEIPLNRPITTVGSNENSRLHLLSRTVSKAHAIFVNTGGLTYVADLASRTGVLVNAKLVRDVVLKDGDRVQIGKFVFRYRLPPNSPAADFAESPAAAVIVVGWPALPVTGKAVTIGRSERSDIDLSGDASVSSPHAVIFQAEGKWYIRDLGSRTGTNVNGKAIHQQSLNFGDRVVIGSSTILFQPGAALDEQSSLIESEPTEAPQIATQADTEVPTPDLDDAIPLADEEPAAIAESNPVAIESETSEASPLEEALPLEEVPTDLTADEPPADEPPAVDWAATPATDLPTDQDAASEPLPLEDLPAETASPSPAEVDWSAASATALPQQPADENASLPLEDAPIPLVDEVDSVTTEPVEQLVAAEEAAEPVTPAPAAEVQSPPEPVSSADESDEDDIFDWNPTASDTTLPPPTHTAPLADSAEDKVFNFTEEPAVEPPVVEVDAEAIAEVASPATLDLSMPQAPEVEPPHEESTLPETNSAELPTFVQSEPIEPEPVAAEPIAEEVTAAEPVATEPIAAEPIAAEPESERSEANAVEPLTSEAADSLPVAEATEAEENVEHEPVPVDATESSWLNEPATNEPATNQPAANEPTPSAPPSTPVIPPLPAWPAGGAAAPPIDVHAPVDDFVFVPTDTSSDENTLPDLLFFGDETPAHEVATDPVLVDRLEHSQAKSTDAAFDAAVEESLHDRVVEPVAMPTDPAAHFDPAVADAAFDAALDETFTDKTGTPDVAANTQSAIPSADLLPEEAITTTPGVPQADELEDRVAHFNAALAEAELEKDSDPAIVDESTTPPITDEPPATSPVEAISYNVEEELSEADLAEAPDLAARFSPSVADAAFDAALDDTFGDALSTTEPPGIDEAEPSWLTDELPAPKFTAPDITSHVVPDSAPDIAPVFDKPAESADANPVEAQALLPQPAPEATSAEPLVSEVEAELDPVDLHSLDLEDESNETSDSNISWASVEEELPTEPPAPPAAQTAISDPADLEDSLDHSDEQAIGWSAIVSHDDEPADGVTTLSESVSVPTAEITDAANLEDLDFLDSDEQPGTEPVADSVDTIEEPSLPDGTPVDQAPAAPIEPPAPTTQADDKPADAQTSSQGPAQGPSIFGFQFEGGSFLGGMPISLHQPEVPEVPPTIFDAGKTKPAGIESLVTPPAAPAKDRPATPAPPKTRRPLTVPRPALPKVGDATAAGKSMAGLVGEANSTWAATPVIPPVGKGGPKRKGLTTAFNSAGMAARNADVFSQLAAPIGVEVFAGKPTESAQAAVNAPEAKTEQPRSIPPSVSPAIAPLPPLKKSRRSRLPWLIVLFVGIPAGLWGLEYKVPQVSSKLVTAKLVGSLQFDGFTALSPVDAHAFLADQQARLASDEVRLMAQRILENNHQPPGFTASSDEYSRTVDMQSLNWSGNTLQLTFNSNDPVSGSAQVNAVLTALAKKDQDLEEARNRAKQAADEARADENAAAARVQQLSAQRHGQVDLAQDSPDLSTVNSADQEAATLAQKYKDAKTVRENSEAVLADLRSKDPSKPVDVEADPQVVELRKRLDPLKEQIARLKGIGALAAGTTPNAIPAGATTQPEGDVDPLLAPLQQQADLLAKKLDQRRSELAPDAALTAAQREVQLASRIENLSVKITAMRQAEDAAKTAADTAAAKARQNHDRLSAARLAGVKAEDLYNQEAEAEADRHRAVELQTERELTLANCVTVAAIPIAPPTQFPASDLRPSIWMMATGLSTVVFGLMILGELRRPRLKVSAKPAAIPAAPPKPVIPWPRSRELNGLQTKGQDADLPEEQPPIVGEPDQVFGL